MDKATPELAEVVRNCSAEEGMKKAQQQLGEITLTLEDFKGWYYNSLFWTARKAELSNVAEQTEGVGFSFSNPLDEQIKYIFLWPLLSSLGNTLCDPHEEGKEM